MDIVTQATGETPSHMAVDTAWEEAFAADLEVMQDGVVDTGEAWAEEEHLLLSEDGLDQSIPMGIHIP